MSHRLDFPSELVDKRSIDKSHNIVKHYLTDFKTYKAYNLRDNRIDSTFGVRYDIFVGKLLTNLYMR